ncbi:MAG: hypothetical protein WC229_01855 [Candidatus Paceibacterota bacterium]|jgi:hypothetical protein
MPKKVVVQKGWETAIVIRVNQDHLVCSKKIGNKYESHSFVVDLNKHKKLVSNGTDQLAWGVNSALEDSLMPGDHVVFEEKSREIVGWCSLEGYRSQGFAYLRETTKKEAA